MQSTQDRKSGPEFTSDAIKVFEIMLRDFHQGACRNAEQLATSSHVVSTEVMCQAIVKTCLAIAERCSSAAETSGGKKVA